MPLNDLLGTGRIAILDQPGDRNAVLGAVARLLAQPGLDATALHDQLLERERLASTAIGHGVAIPHARLDGLARGRGAFLRLAHPVDFGGEPVDLVVALAMPGRDPQQHLQRLAEIAERFADPPLREGLRAAADATALGRCLLGPGARRRAA